MQRHHWDRNLIFSRNVRSAVDNPVDEQNRKDRVDKGLAQYTDAGVCFTYKEWIAA